MQDSVRTVLLIEDDDGVRNLLRTLLRLAGYETLSCQQGSEAVELMEARGGSLHLLITDVNLGGAMDGFEAAALLRDRQPSLKVLFMSGEDEAEPVPPGSVREADRFLRKPFAPRAFAEAVAFLLRTADASAVS